MGLWDSLLRLWSTPATTAKNQARNPDGQRATNADAHKTSAFAILVAPFYNDTTLSLTQSVAEAIGGRSGLIVQMASSPIGPVDDSEEVPVSLAAAVNKGRSLLESSDCQVLVWGEVIDGRALRLRFLPRQMEGEFASGELLAGDSLDLPVPPGTTVDLALGGALAALQLSTDHDRKHRLDRLRTAINAVDLVLQDGGIAWPVGGKVRAAILYATMMSEMAYRTGHRPTLLRASEILRTCLAPGSIESLSPANRAAASLHYGDVLSELSHGDTDETTLTNAVQALRQAARFYQHKQLPEESAQVSVQLGRALQRLSKRSNNTSHMKEGAQAFIMAAQVWTSVTRPDRWADLQTGIGSLLGQVAEFSGNAEIAERAVMFFTAATRIWSRDKDPRRWANVMNNIGAVRFAQGKRSGDVSQLREATECFSKALEIYTMVGMTRNIHVIQKNIARVERLIASQSS